MGRAEQTQEVPKKKEVDRVKDMARLCKGYFEKLRKDIATNKEAAEVRRFCTLVGS